MKRRLINALRAGSTALDRLAQAVGAGEPDELEQVRARLNNLEAHQHETTQDVLLLQEWARAEADYSEWCEVPGSASQASLGDRLRADRRNAARKAGGAS